MEHPNRFWRDLAGVLLAVFGYSIIEDWSLFRKMVKNDSEFVAMLEKYPLFNADDMVLYHLTRFKKNYAANTGTPS